MAKVNPKSKSHDVNDSAMRESIKSRTGLEARFGFRPMSVLTEIKRGRLSKSMFCYQAEHRKFNSGKQHHDVTRMVTTSDGVWGGRPKGLTLSIMPAEVVEFFVKFYAKPGDVYVDPFMGQGVQMQVAKLLGLHYYGYDLSTEFFQYIDAVRKKIDDGRTRINITHGDSRFPSSIPDGIGDFSFHSPPYWDIEEYGDDPGQLGDGTYEEFMQGMEDVARAWLPKFKSGAVHIVNVNDFRKNGRFYSYHADTIRAYKNAGWDLHDTWILSGIIGKIASIFWRGMTEQRIAPRNHEYALVFKAP